MGGGEPWHSLLPSFFHPATLSAVRFLLFPLGDGKREERRREGERKFFWRKLKKSGATVVACVASFKRNLNF